VFTLQVIRFISVSYGILGFTSMLPAMILRYTSNAYENAYDCACGYDDDDYHMALVTTLGRARR